MNDPTMRRAATSLSVDHEPDLCPHAGMAEPRSTEMHSLHEVLARERMRELRHQAQRSRVARELAAAERWRRREQRARAAHQRHAQRAEQAAGASAVAVAR